MIKKLHKTLISLIKLKKRKKWAYWMSSIASRRGLKSKLQGRRSLRKSPLAMSTSSKSKKATSLSLSSQLAFPQDKTTLSF
jgi:hypothetical protein